jgi:succinoglycan biosynthesis protein ExoM
MREVSAVHMKIAICICTCNRAWELDRLLGVLATVEIPNNSEVFVQIVDNAPDGRARAVWERHSSFFSIPIYFAEERQRGISFARNRAVADALAHDPDLLSFIDDDDTPDTDWLKALVAVQNETNSPIVFGLYDLPSALLPNWMREVRPYRKPIIEQLNRFGFPVWASSRNVLLCRDVLESIAAEDGVLFRPAFALTGSEDTDFFIRALQRGWRYAIAPPSIVTLGISPERMTVRGVLRLGFRFGACGVLLDRYYKPRQQFRRDRLRRILSFPKLLLPLLLLPARRQRGTLVTCLYDISKRLGEISASMGEPFRYYR